MIRSASPHSAIRARTAAPTVGSGSTPTTRAAPNAITQSASESPKPQAMSTTTSPGRSRAASVPQLMFNAYVTYQFDNGFGASFGPQLTGEQWQNQEGSLRIPLQYTLNAFVFYRRPRWEVQVNFMNLTDERNWTSIDPSFAGNDVIFPEQPFRVSGQVRFKF